MNTSKCAGCSEDFYNGKNPYDVKECWHLKDAKVILRRRVGINDVPPWKRKPERLPSCYRERGYVFVGPKVER